MLPGHVAARLDERALTKLLGQLPLGVAVVSGTNGKTTTSRMVSQIAQRAGLRPIANRSGANLTSGILAAVVTNATLSGRAAGDLAVLEVDEAHVAGLLKRGLQTLRRQLQETE